MELRLEQTGLEESDAAGHVIKIPKQSNGVLHATASGASVFRDHNLRWGWEGRRSDNAEIWCCPFWEFWLSTDIEPAISTLGK